MDTSLIIYAAKVSLALMLFYALHFILFRKDTFFGLKRFYFLAVIPVSILYPFVRLSKTIEIETSGYLVNYIQTSGIINGGNTINNATLSGDLSVSNILLFIAFTGTLLLSLRLLYQLGTIFLIIRKERAERKGLYTIIETNNSRIHASSFFNYIFINPAFNIKDKHKIIAHESVHVRQMHSVDMLLAELLCIFFWWNPFSWMIRKEITTNLEYLADHDTLKQGINKKDYQYTLLECTTKNTGISIINNFNVSQLKKRIMMMNKKKTRQIMSVKYLLMIPIFAGLLYCNIIKASSATAAFGNGTDAGVSANPNIQLTDKNGTIELTFDMDDNGKISNIKVVKGVNTYIENEMIAMIKYLKPEQIKRLCTQESEGKYSLIVGYKVDNSFKATGKEQLIVEKVSEDPTTKVIQYTVTN